jgi:hypothetical protein
VNPRIFIGSASEDLPIANAVFAELEDASDPLVWDQGIFGPSSYLLEELEQVVKSFDYAVLVLGPTDQRMSRGDTSLVPRDNVVAELGFFMGALGRRNVFMLTPRNGDLALPTDFLGLITLSYNSRVDNLRAAVRTACSTIKDRVVAPPRLGGAMAWPLDIAVVSSDTAATQRLGSQLGDYTTIVRTRTHRSAASAKAMIAGGEVDALIIDPFSIGAREGIDLIAYVRDRHRQIGVALYGTFKDLYKLPGLGALWSNTLQHYWRLSKDASDEAFAVTLEDIVLMFFVYRLSGGKFGENPGEVAVSMMTPEVAGSWQFWATLR